MRRLPMSRGPPCSRRCARSAGRWRSSVAPFSTAMRADVRRTGCADPSRARRACEANPLAGSLRAGHMPRHSHGGIMEFHLPTRVRFGRGRIPELGALLPDEIERVMIVSDAQVLGACGALEAIAGALRGREVGFFCDVEANPSFATVETAAAAARDAGSQLIVGLGGGSPMDAAKGVSVLATTEASLRCVLCAPELVRPPLPVICVPTTAGSGSEVTPYAVFTDSDDQSKQGYAHPGLYPIAALIDPELTFSMSPAMIIDTGLDVLTHAIEAYLCTEANVWSDLHALRAIDLVIEQLPTARRRDEDAMTAMSWAATLGGVAIAQAGTTLLHVMGYPLTVFQGISHGRANAVLLPAYLEFLSRSTRVPERMAEIEERLAPRGGARGLLRELGVPLDLTSYGVAAEDLDRFVAKCVGQTDLAITPAAIDAATIRAIYERAMP
ncbi:MAG: iron-containing alcohol dehydrogenase [Candidatus Eisenbacteria bacterium]|nr:iron-containing alcohol dehydrogenase [Candidatus Eisenbacteria bacterium]